MFIHCHIYSLSYLFTVMFIHCHVYSLSCLFTIMFIHCHVYSLSCLFTVMFIHCQVYLLLCSDFLLFYISLSLEENQSLDRLSEARKELEAIWRINQQRQNVINRLRHVMESNSSVRGNDSER